MIVLIARILAIGALIVGFWLSAKYWDGKQIISLITHGILFSLLCMVPVGIIILLLQGLMSVLGFVVVAVAIGLVIYFLYKKFR